MQLSFIVQAISLALIGSQFSASYALDVSASSRFNEASNRQSIEDQQGFASFQRLTAEDDHAHEDHADEDHTESNSKPWGKVIGTTLLINMATLAGIIFLVPAFSKKMKHRVAAAICWTADQEVHAHEHDQCDEDISEHHSQMLDIFIPSFAAGALLSTVVFLVLPESITLLNNAMMESQASAASDTTVANRFLQETADEHAEHSEEHGAELDTGAVWRFGAGVLGGFMLPILIGALFPRSVEHECDSACGPAEMNENDVLAKCMVESEHCAACDENGDEKKELNETSPDLENGHDHGHDHSHSHQHGEDCSTCKVDIISEDDVKDVEVPEWKKKALETRADPQAAPFGMSWNTEGTISATQAYNNELELEEPLDHTCNVVKREPKPINYSLALSILLGDSFHNFCDGIFIGVAFMLCDNATALTIVFITLYHEVAQELADFFLLTKHAGLTVTKALAVNFLSGLSVVLGGIVVLSIGVSDLTIGVILSIASGVYLYIAASECVPRVNAVVKSNTDRLVTVLAFIVGAVPIGLTLLNHSHCEA